MTFLVRKKLFERVMPAWVGGFTVFPFIFLKSDITAWIRPDNLPEFENDVLLWHEQIHFRQQWECLIVGLGLAFLWNAFAGFSWIAIALAVLGFYIIYGAHYLILRFIYGFDAQAAYLGIVFEEEAYDMQFDIGYLARRPFFAWIHYLWRGPEDGALFGP